MPKSVLSSISDTVTLLLNTPIVPPLSKRAKDVALTELPHSTPRRRAEALELERARSVDLAAGDVCLLVGNLGWHCLNYLTAWTEDVRRK
ncbi:hypothetical protein CY34DRAFT_798643 [Suillus luteus UH-Slu-Lm8-n1]|uniref:Uncharacterized protein n=1 Tax=Suillus luteus UH-Slu-Lm8-n1 TaxID=930992 RepID=A0A0D0BZ09_9AGAM|nr:hypothetical protein CY34DRAFT_798643 [Suillus luteus UH-Slu-Lm8-n1]